MNTNSNIELQELDSLEYLQLNDVLRRIEIY